MMSISEGKYKNELNYKMKIIEIFLKSSYFPEMVQIDNLTNEKIQKEEIIIIGYDSVYTYYYTEKYIAKRLKSSGFKDFDKEDYIYRKMPFYEVYSSYLYNIEKSNLKIVKNNKYKIIERLEKNYYEIEKKK